ncbi:hypothetical protein EK21DRAFT_91498 [Setomelanomma holmii]|uniref:Uncharacterized protein n=1 Tax=Setomelanomma holmii TaxID=210430 RepID=A0A9P4H6B0_9PLEO|nr:hypothetical protein EK21DRAFT_91498 [Setomelanomma holmii]
MEDVSYRRGRERVYSMLSMSAFSFGCGTLCNLILFLIFPHEVLGSNPWAWFLYLSLQGCFSMYITIRVLECLVKRSAQRWANEDMTKDEKSTEHDIEKAVPLGEKVGFHDPISPVQVQKTLDTPDNVRDASIFTPEDTSDGARSSSDNMQPIHGDDEFAHYTASATTAGSDEDGTCSK